MSLELQQAFGLQIIETPVFLLYELDGTLKGVRKTGSYTSAPGGVHSEGAGDTDCIVIYNIRGNGRDEMFDMLDETVQNVGKIG